MSDFDHLLSKCQDAASGGWGALSTGEQLAAALVLNRSDWLEQLGYTMAQAIDRVGPDWVSMIPDVEKILRNPEGH